MTIKTRYIALGIAALFFSVDAMAESYQAEAGVYYFSESEDPNTDLTLTGVVGAYYFAPITPSGPKAEAPFLAKVGSVTAAWATGDIESPGSTMDLDSMSFALEYVLSGSDIVLGVDTTSVEISSIAFTSDTTLNSVSIGKYLDDMSLLTFSYGTGDIEITGFPTTDTTDMELSYKRLFESGGNTINLEASYASANEDDTITDLTNSTTSVRGDYYLDDTFSLGLGYAVNSGDDASKEGATVTAAALQYFTDNFFVELEYESFSADSIAGDDSESFTLSLVGEF